MVVKQYMVLLYLYRKKVIKSNKIDNQFKNLQIRFEDLLILSLNLICSSNLFVTIIISYLEIFYSEKDGSLLMTRVFKCSKNI